MTYLAHCQTNCQTAIQNMSDSENKQKPVQLLKTLVWNKRFMTLHSRISIFRRVICCIKNQIFHIKYDSIWKINRYPLLLSFS